MTEQLSILPEIQPSVRTKVVNVSSVPQRSPFRYPGGKTWLIPTVRAWLRQDGKAKRLIEPFAGGGVVSLTAAFEDLAEHVTMVELDDEVAAVWEVVINGHANWLANKILNFELSNDNVIRELANPMKSLRELAFCTILKNRVFHGGIIAKGSGMLKHGENGKGIASRWYAQTLANRIRAIGEVRKKIDFVRGDGFVTLAEHTEDRDAFFLIDPPYTVAGKRLYTHFDIDHERLFAMTSKLRGRFMLTYDDTLEIRSLTSKYNLEYRTIPMKTTHHLEKHEIIISDNFDWWK